MKHRAFVFSGMALLLAIPVLILAASFVSMLNTGSEGVFVSIRGEKTFSLFESADKDLDRAVDIAGRRAVIAAADYISLYGECLTSSTYNNPPYGTGVEGAIRELIITGNLTSVNHGVFSSLVTQGSTLQDWIREFSGRAQALGFDVNITISPEDIYITPVNDTWYYATLKVDAVINDSATRRWIYSGTIPRSGNTTRLISGEGIGVNVFNCEEEAVNQPPNSTITTPSNGSSLSCNTTWINGTASDDSSVSEVRVNINGTWYSATLTNPGAATTDWYLSWTPSEDGNYPICSYAIDNNNTAQSPGYCITVTVNGCPIAACNIILDPSYSPWTLWSWVRYRILNNDQSNSVTIDNMTVAWNKTGVNLYSVSFGNEPVWSQCVGNNTKIDISPDQTLNPQQTSTITMRFRYDTCSRSPSMYDTHFNVTFETDRGVCSVEFDT